MDKVIKEAKVKVVKQVPPEILPSVQHVPDVLDAGLGQDACIDQSPVSKGTIFARGTGAPVQGTEILTKKLLWQYPNRVSTLRDFFSVI